MKMALSGAAALQKALREFSINADREIAAAVNGTAQNIRAHAIKSIMRGPKTGETYKKTKPKRTHKASAPGQAPATDTGRLAGSIQADVSGRRAEVYTNAAYAAPLEFGTTTIEPRPFMVPAMEKERPAFIKRLDAVVEKAARGIIK